MIIRSICAAAVVLVLASPAGAQHDMAGHTAALPASAGQSAFATIAEVVAILKNDPKTDWSKVDLEALRQHLVDMNDVVLNAVVAKRDVPGGVETTVTGTGRTGEAIRRMLSMHAMMLAQLPEYEATAADVANGVRLTVTAKDRNDPMQVARIRGLGFAGLLTEGDHHARHHLALARGEGHSHAK